MLCMEKHSKDSRFSFWWSEKTSFWRKEELSWDLKQEGIAAI